MLRRFQMNVGDQADIDLMADLDGLYIDAFFIEQEGGDIDRHLRVHGGGVVLHGFFFENTQNMQCGRFGAANVTGTRATRAGDVARLGEGRAQALTGQFHQAEAADLAGLHARAVEFQPFAQASFHFALIARALHVDEVDDDQAAQVAQTQLAGDFLGGFEVGFERRLLDIGATGGTPGVHVDGNQRLGVIDDDRAARR